MKVAKKVLLGLALVLLTTGQAEVQGSMLVKVLVGVAREGHPKHEGH